MVVKDVTDSGDKFEKLLKWLDADDRDRAGVKYEEIRHSLLKILTWNGCHEAEELADQAINIVTDKIDEISETFGRDDDPALYFYGVARKLRLESIRRAKLRAPLPEDIIAETPPPDLTGDELEHSERINECLKRCVAALSPLNRETALAYYRYSKQAKIVNRKALAEEAGVTMGNLRVKLYRIRLSLEKCIRQCLEEGAQ
jgi:DNA-directed RNA polymerase specialized sigma24 family protein